MLEQLLALQDIHNAAALIIPVKPVFDVQIRFSEKLISPFILKHQEGPLNGAHGLRRNIAILQLIFLGIVTHILNHAAKILQIQKQKAPVIGNLEHDAQNAALSIVKTEQPAEQFRSHIGNRCPNRVSLFPVDIEKPGRIGSIIKVFDMHRVDAAADMFILNAGHTHARQVSLDIREKYRNAHIAEGLRNDLERDSFSGTGRSGDEPVAVAHGGL